MAAKVVWYRNAWWVRTHHRRKKKDRRVGPTKADKRQADEIARKINAAIALGTFAISEPADEPLPCGAQLERWHATYAPTFKPSFEQESKRIVENHLVPFFLARSDKRRLLRELGVRVRFTVPERGVISVDSIEIGSLRNACLFK